ncbi:hypothetical protein [Bacteroides sp. 51]|uniref:hypothetical protein n=1 Tax=Bacteroides sp. 51 TaxID=2302938 RepID=UPI0013D01BAF|nr:hypothetical protein [Bacteroides sp. 51]
MAKLLFPTNIFPGLVFNDFVDKDPSMARTYLPYAAWSKKTAKSDVLIMDEDRCEAICIDSLNPIPQWLLYHIDRQRTVATLNRFIFSTLTCIIKDPEYCLFTHPADVYVHVWKDANNVYTYLLTRVSL